MAVRVVTFLLAFILGYTQCQKQGLKTRMPPSSLVLQGGTSPIDASGRGLPNPSSSLANFNRMPTFPMNSRFSVSLPNTKSLPRPGITHTVVRSPSIRTISTSRFLPTTIENLNQGTMLQPRLDMKSLVLTRGENVDNTERIRLKNPDNGFVEFTDPTASPQPADRLVEASPSVLSGNAAGDTNVDKPAVFRESVDPSASIRFPGQQFGNSGSARETSFGPFNPNGNFNWNSRFAGGPGNGDFRFTNGPRPGDFRFAEGPGGQNFQFQDGPGPSNFQFSEGPSAGPSNFEFSSGPRPNNFPFANGPRGHNFEVPNGPSPNGFRFFNGPRSNNFVGGLEPESLRFSRGPVNTNTFNSPPLQSFGTSSQFGPQNLNVPPFTLERQTPFPSGRPFLDTLSFPQDDLGIPSSRSGVPVSSFPRNTGNPFQPSPAHLLTGPLLASDNNFLDSSDSLLLSSMLMPSNSFGNTLLLAGLNDNIDFDIPDRFWMTSLLASNSISRPQSSSFPSFFSSSFQPSFQSSLPFSLRQRGTMPRPPVLSQQSFSNDRFPVFQNRNNLEFSNNFRSPAPLQSFPGNFLAPQSGFSAPISQNAFSTTNGFAQSNFLPMRHSGGMNFGGRLGSQRWSSQDFSMIPQPISSPPGLQFLGGSNRMFDQHHLGHSSLLGQGSNAWTSALFGSMLMDDMIATPTKRTKIRKNVQPITIEKTPTKAVRLSEITVPAVRRIKVDKRNRTF